MPGEVDTQGTPAEQATGTQDETLDAEFELGFDESTEVKPAEEPKTEGSEEPPATEEPKTEEPAPEETVTVKKSEWDRVLAAVSTVDRMNEQFGRQVSTALGKVGSLEQRLTQLQQQTPTGQSVEISAEDFAELKTDFPDLADMTLKGLQRVMGRMKGTGGAPAAPVKVVTPEEIAAIALQTRRAEEEKALAEDHQNWREIVGSPEDKDNEYRKWLAKQSEAYQKRVTSTERASVVSESISKFLTEKAAAAQAAEKEQKAAEERERAKSLRRDQLKAAATPKAAGGHAPGKSDDDDFQEGFDAG